MSESQLHELLDAYLSGELDDAGRTWLQVELAAADPETLRSLMDQMAIDRALRVHLGTEDAAGDRRVVDSVLAHLCLGSPEDFRARLMARIGGRRPEQPVSPSRLAAVTGATRPSEFRPWHAAVLTAAACLFVVFAMKFLGSKEPARPLPPPRVAEAPAPPAPDPVDPWFKEGAESRLRSAERMRREYVRRWFEQVGEAPPVAPPATGMAEPPAPVAPPVEVAPAPEPAPERPAVAEAPEPVPEKTAPKQPEPEKPAPVARDRSRESVVLEARLEKVEGAVFALSDRKRSEAYPMQALFSGHGVQTGRDGRASIRYADGTRLALEPGSTISLAGHHRGQEPRDTIPAGKAVFVVEGALAAEVAKQPDGRPMLFASPQAEVRVLGTQLVVSVNPAATQVEVREGRVRVTRREEAGSVEVAAGQFAVAARGIPLKARPVLDTRGLLMWLRLDEGRGGIATDASGRGHHGYLKGGPAWIEGHAGGYGIRLDASDSIRVRATPTLCPVREVAVSLWVRPADVDKGGSDVLSMGDSYAIRILGNGNVSFFFYNGKKWVVCTTKQTRVGDGRWHHIVGQKTAKRLEVYVDGVLKGSNPTVVPIVYSLGSHFYVGRHGDRKTQFFFSGAVDDVRVYNRPLNASEIRALRTAK